MKVQSIPCPRGVRTTIRKASTYYVTSQNTNQTSLEYESVAHPFGEMDWTVVVGYLRGRTEVNHANGIVGAVVGIRNGYETQARLLC